MYMCDERERGRVGKEQEGGREGEGERRKEERKRKGGRKTKKERPQWVRTHYNCDMSQFEGTERVRIIWFRFECVTTQLS